MTRVSKACRDRGDALSRRAPQGGTVVEVGVLIAHMTEYVLHLRPDLTWIMVDSWLPESQQPETYRATGDVHARHDLSRAHSHRQQTFQRSVSLPGTVGILAMPSVRAAGLLADGSVDLVFLDGDHSHEGVVSDIRAWLPKIRAGGVIGGHDYDNPEFSFGVRSAVDDWVSQSGARLEIDANYTWWARV